MPRVYIAKPTGFCFGVERAVRLAREALKKYGQVWTYGELVHNPDVLAELEREGIRPILRIRTLKGGALIIRAHGCPQSVLDRCRNLKVEVVDATCPYVQRVQNVARKLSEEGYRVVVIGEKNHPEVRSILSSAGENAVVFSPDTDKFSVVGKKGLKLGVVAQTTIDRDGFKSALANLLNFGYTEIRVFDTICAEVSARQAATARLAQQVEAVIVVGGKNSANTARLAQIVRAKEKAVAHIARPKELNPAEWRRYRKIGIAAGASTPAAVVLEIAQILNNAGVSDRRRHRV